MPANAGSQPKGSGDVTPPSGPATPETRQSELKSRDVERPDEQLRRLRRYIRGFGLLWLFVLVGLTFVGLRATRSEVNRHYPTPPSAATPTATATASVSPTATRTPTGSPTAARPGPSVSPTATATAALAQINAAAQANESPAGTATASASPTGTATASASPTGTATPSASPTGTATPSASPTGTATPSASPTATPNTDAARFAAYQHFLILAVLTSTMVLFPWVLLLAFAHQTAPRLYRNLKNDLTALGLYRAPEQMKRNLEKTLTATIEPTLEATEDAAKTEYVNQLLSYAQNQGTGRGGSRPSDVEESVWDKAYKKADETRRVKDKDKDKLGQLEIEISGLIQSGLKLARKRLATRYARHLVKTAVEGSTDPGPAPMPRIDDPKWQEAFQEAQKDAGSIAEEIKAAEERIGVKQRFGVTEFLLPLLSLTPIVMVSFVWAFWPEATFGFVNQMAASASLNNYFGVVVAKMAPAAVAVITAYLFMMFGLMRRYHRSDITPGAYWEVLNRLIVVFLLGLVGSAFLWADTDPDGNFVTRGAAAVAPTVAIALGIVAGVFPVDTLRFLVKAALSRFRKWLAGNKPQEGEDLSKRLEKLHPLSLLDDLDPWDELRLTEEGIIGIQGMATADITHLLIWTPFTTQQIVDWVDQSILFLAAGAEPDAQYIRRFRKLGLRGASDLVDATLNEVGKKTVVAAAQTVEKAAATDSLTLSQLAALRAQLKVKDAQERVSEVKDKQKEDALDVTTRTKITSAVSVIRDARETIDSAVARVKPGGETLAAALDAANSLQARFKSACDKAGDVEALSSATEKVTEELATKLKALGEELTGDPDANSQAQALVDALDQIAKPLAQTEAKAREFEEKARVIRKKAEIVQADVPGEVGEAESLFNSLTELAQEAQKRIKADPAQADAVGMMDDLVKLLTDVSADKPKKLLLELKQKEQWTVAGEGNRAKSYGNAEKVVGQSGEILRKAQGAARTAEDARQAATLMGAGPPLTMEVLVTLLNGLERNANLRRIQRYLTCEVADIPSPASYVSNVEWLGTSHQGETLEQKGTS